MAKAEGKQLHRFLKQIEWLAGVVPKDTNNPDQAVVDCWFCDKVEHANLYINKKDGTWFCQRCGEKGNGVSFMSKFCRKVFADTQLKAYRELAEAYHLPPEVASVFKSLRWGKDPQGRWIVPGYNEQGTQVHTVYRREPNNRFYQVEGGRHQLLGGDTLAKASPGNDVWLVEGHTDWPAWRYALDKAGSRDHIVVAAPGANSFKPEWVPLFREQRVRLCGDNDGAGDGMNERVGGLLEKDVRPPLQYVCWPETYKMGYDLRDAIVDSVGQNRSILETVELIEHFLKPEHRRATAVRLLEENKTGTNSLNPVNADGEPEPAEKRPVPSFPEVVSVFRKWIPQITDDFVDALTVALAVCISPKVPGLPLWVYLVGPASSGKTTICLAMKDSKHTTFYSTLSRSALISGWASGPDRSLIPKFNGKCAVIKDGTVMLSKGRDEKFELYQTLADAYDGTCCRPFGHMATKTYNSKFNMLIGVTKIVYADNIANRGARFLNLALNEPIPDLEDALIRSMDNAVREEEMHKEFRTVCGDFLERDINPDTLPMIPHDIKQRLAALSQLLAILRAGVDKDQYGDKEMLYRPEVELPFRIVKQFTKMAKLIAFVQGKSMVDLDTYRLMKKMASDTCVGFHLDICGALMRVVEEGMTIEELEKRTKLPRTLLRSRLDDLAQLEAVTWVKVKDTENPLAKGGITKWRASAKLKMLWQKSRVTQTPPPKATTPPLRLSEPLQPQHTKNSNGGGPLLERNSYDPFVNPVNRIGRTA